LRAKYIRKACRKSRTIPSLKHLLQIALLLCLFSA
jgi:hypothetical protein